MDVDETFNKAMCFAGWHRSPEGGEEGRCRGVRAPDTMPEGLKRTLEFLMD